ncbi:MAG: DUF1697 domain-containing protein [Patescibacteria group bacterium]
MKYICFLRAINVGGNNIIKMDKLKTVFEKAGFSDVQTYIQTGNVIFSGRGSKKELKNKIEKAIRKELHLDIEAGVLRLKTLEELVKENPFAKKKQRKDTKQYVAFFMDQLSQKPKLPAKTSDHSYELFYPHTQYACILRSTTQGKYDQYKKLLQDMIPCEVTVRTWGVVEKIVAKANAHN